VDVKTYSRQVSSYIDLESIRYALHCRTQERVLGIKSIDVRLSEDEEGNVFLKLIGDYLKYFSISNDVIELIRVLDGVDAYSEEAIASLKNYQFNNDVQLNQHNKNISTNADRKITVSAEADILQIISGPIAFLYNYVSHLSETWHNDVPANVFLQHSQPSQLFVYIEREVAMTSKKYIKAKPGKNAKNEIVNGYRYVCLTSELPIDSKMMKISMDLAEYQASSTLTD